MIAEPRPHLSPITKEEIKKMFEDIGYKATVRVNSHSFGKMAVVNVLDKEGNIIIHGSGNVFYREQIEKHPKAFAVFFQLNSLKVYLS